MNPSQIVDDYIAGPLWTDNQNRQAGYLIGGSGKFLQVINEPVAELQDGWSLSWSVDEMLGPQGISFNLRMTATKDGETWGKVIGHGPDGTDQDWTQQP